MSRCTARNEADSYIAQALRTGMSTLDIADRFSTCQTMVEGLGLRALTSPTNIGQPSFFAE